LRPSSIFVQYPRNRKEWFNTKLLTAAGQPFNSFGVEVNEDLQPVDPAGRVVYRNLFAAGGILAHADSMAEKSGGGVAISRLYGESQRQDNFFDFQHLNGSAEMYL
jgi:anaerobic glycerol-3-phosphate dehydrogenase